MVVDTMLLSDLPDAALAHAASYLAPPSRALWAAALTAPSSSWRGVGPGIRAIRFGQRHSGADAVRAQRLLGEIAPSASEPTQILLFLSIVKSLKTSLDI